MIVHVCDIKRVEGTFTVTAASGFNQTTRTLMVTLEKCGRVNSGSIIYITFGSSLTLMVHGDPLQMSVPCFFIMVTNRSVENL